MKFVSPYPIRTCAMTMALAGCLFAACTAVAEEAKPRYAALATPTEPKVDVHWNRYHDYAEATALLKQLAEKYPQYCRLKSLGKSYGKREMWVMTISDFESGDPEKKPAMWIDGGIHANEIQSVEVVLYTAWYLAEMAGQNETVARLLNERTFYLCPMMSPDSRDAHFYEANTTHSPRSGQRPVDDDRDGQVDEDDHDDLNGDGHITQMRIRDPNGTHKPHEEYPSHMVRVEKEERGTYRILGREGIDNDDDGRVNEDGDGSYDPNRNWPWMWQPEYVQSGAHRYPLSIPENRMVAEFIMSRPNIIGGQSYHNAGGMLLRGPGAKSDTFERDDIRVFDELGKTGEEILPGYRYMNIANDLYEVYGGSIDWMYQSRGAFVFTNEMFTSFNFFGRHSEGGFFGNDEDQQKFNKLLLLDDAIVPWEEVDHPTYGKIEVGGMKKSWLRQPPGFMIEEELHRNMAFTLYHADQLPLVRIQSVEVKPLGEGLHQVTAIVENQRLLPTHAAVDVKRKITRPDLVSIGGHEVRVVLGMTADEPLFRGPKEQTRKPETIELDRIDGHSVVYVRWLVQGAGPYTIELDSIKGGQDVKATE